MIIDCTVFFNEVDLLEIRLHELDSLVDRFYILEAGETYGGDKKLFNLEANWERFKLFHNKIKYVKLDSLKPVCKDRISGREREVYQRNCLINTLADDNLDENDILIFSDLDEIPNAEVLRERLQQKPLQGITRLKQYSYYYNVNTLTDYGHDWASRARIGYVKHLIEAKSFYEFRMTNKNTEDNALVIERCGWHFSYFGGINKIKTKVDSMNKFLSEYKLFGDEALKQDILSGKDLHHRRCELPEKFIHISTKEQLEQNDLPKYLKENLTTKFNHFTEEGMLWT